MRQYNRGPRYLHRLLICCLAQIVGRLCSEFDHPRLARLFQLAPVCLRTCLHVDGNRARVGFWSCPSSCEGIRQSPGGSAGGRAGCTRSSSAGRKAEGACSRRRQHGSGAVDDDMAPAGLAAAASSATDCGGWFSCHSRSHAAGAAAGATAVAAWHGGRRR